MSLTKILILLLLLLSSCETGTLDNPDPDPGNPIPDNIHFTIFPPFITPIEEYFNLSISATPEIDPEDYRLEIYGTINDSVLLALEDLSMLKQFERALTIECIENPTNGNLIATAEWRGFNLYDLLDSLGIKEGTTIVKYSCADGYFTYNSIEELQNFDVIGALSMNDQPLPPKFGFPLRILFPGYYGVRQPGWVEKIELLESGPEDFWTNRGWDSDSAMAVDSKIFFPRTGESFALGDTVKVGGAAFGPRRITAVDVSIDGGESWIPATITQERDQDFVWVFWETSIVFQTAGKKQIYARASSHGSIQPSFDLHYLDGSNAWPLVNISVFGSE